MSTLLDDCFLHDKDRLKHDEALSILRDAMMPIVMTETLPLKDAAGRFLAESITAPRNIPSTDNSAVDGYAFSFDDHEPTGGFFPITTRIPAGSSAEIELPGFSAARIFTGAPMPLGADSVAMQEDCETHEQDGQRFIIIPSGLKKGANVRKAGEDVKQDEEIISSHTRLRAQDIAAIASTGTDQVSCFKPLRVALISSGDEILRPGDPFVRGKVYDSNHYMLSALLDALPVEMTDLGVCDDNEAAVTSLLKSSTETHDVIISSGGASRGEEDHFINALSNLGKCHLWQLAVKPGRPIGFGQIGQTPCFALPGNPVAAFVCFLLYVRPSLMRLGGGSWVTPQRFAIASDFSITSKPDRREFLRGFLDENSNGEAILKKFDRDGSGLISGLRAASGFIEIPEDCTRVDKGDRVNFIPLSQFGIAE